MHNPSYEKGNYDCMVETTKPSLMTYVRRLFWGNSIERVRSTKFTFYTFYFVQHKK